MRRQPNVYYPNTRHEVYGTVAHSQNDCHLQYQFSSLFCICDEVLIGYDICVDPTLPQRVGCDIRSIFKRGKAGLNLEVSIA